MLERGRELECLWNRRWCAGQSAELLLLHEALEGLETWDLSQAQIVEMRFFVGLSLEEIATALAISVRTVKRDWNLARAWLYAELT
jgi:DNA-directed RNA polymerase specialized sigma24 family protein